MRNHGPLMAIGAAILALSVATVADAAVTAEIEKFATPALKHLAQINARLYAVEPNLRSAVRHDIHRLRD